ncbi:MAG: thiamine diphosphokinase [Calditrichaeota bacterium]|nr:MAG: thiamine diphosphokinase [Calditrichota bacterium]
MHMGRGKYPSPHLIINSRLARRKILQAIIIANSPLPDASRFQAALEQADVIICADGGANHAVHAGIRPQYVVGDFDSVTEETKQVLADSQFIYRPSQYAPDVEKTLEFALEKGVQRATLLGITGGRLDHQICNLNIMEKFSRKMELSCIDDFGAGKFIHSRYAFNAFVGQQVSLFAFRRAEGITTHGLKYPLQNASMEWAVNDGLSNEATAKRVEIVVEKGSLFVYCLWPGQG